MVPEIPVFFCLVVITFFDHHAVDDVASFRKLRVHQCSPESPKPKKPGPGPRIFGVGTVGIRIFQAARAGEFAKLISDFTVGSVCHMLPFGDQVCDFVNPRLRFLLQLA